MDVCRACLCSDTEIINIHKSECDLIFKECTSLDINIDDDLPHGICVMCYNILNQFYFFKQLCNYSNETLKRRLENGSTYVNNVEEVAVVKCVRPDIIDVKDIKYGDHEASSSNDFSVKGKKENKNIQSNLINHYKCGYCLKAFHYKTWLLCHIKMHKKFKNFKCKICKKECISFRNYKQHLVKHYDKDIYKCEKCPKFFISQSRYIIHVKKHNTFETLDCEICHKTFKSNRYYKQHLSMHFIDENSDKVFKCDHCGKIFIFKSKLIRHLDSHKPTKDLICNVCNKKFKCRYSFVKHVSKHQNNEDDTNLIYKNDPQIIDPAFLNCKICNGTFKSMRYFKQHILMHSIDENSEKAYKCEHCSKMFLFKSKFDRHLETHKKGGKQICEICQKTFKSKDYLRRHMPSHFRKTYKCMFCNKIYVCKNKFDEHIKLHD